MNEEEYILQPLGFFQCILSFSESSPTSLGLLNARDDPITAEMAETGQLLEVNQGCPETTLVFKYRGHFSALYFLFLETHMKAFTHFLNLVQE